MNADVRHIRQNNKTKTSPPDVFEPELRSSVQKTVKSPTMISNDMASHENARVFVPLNHTSSSNDLFQANSDLKYKDLSICTEESKLPVVDNRNISQVQVPEQDVPSPIDTPHTSCDTSPKGKHEFVISDHLKIYKYTSEQIESVKYDDKS